MFNKIKKFIFHIDKYTDEIEGNNNRGELYENDLYTKFGDCKKYTSYGINILFITDTHNCLAYTDKYLNYLKSLRTTDYDICIILGDVSGLDIDAIKSIIPKEKLFGIVGNHDSINSMDINNITNIHGKVIQCKGIKIAAIMGSNRYKQGDYGTINQEESIQIAESMKTADILVSHDKAYIWDKNDNVHDGLKGITYYLYKNHVPIHIHGHLHEEFEELLKNGTKSLGLFQIKLLQL